MNKFLEQFTLSPGDALVLTRPVIWKPLALRARKLLIASAAGLLFTFFLFPTVSAPVFKKVYSITKSSNDFFGGLSDMFSAKGTPKWRIRQGQWQTGLYVLFAGLGIAALWRALGPTAREAREQAAEFERTGRECIQSGRLEQALAKLVAAQQWTADLAHRKTIDATVIQLRTRVAAQTVGTPLPPAGTAVLNPQPQSLDRTLALNAAEAGGTMVMQAPANTVANGRYEIRRLLGRGGMGEVFEAHDTALDRTVALKKLPAHLASDPQFVQRFTLEAKALAQLAHANIVSVFDIIRDAGGVYMALEYVSGGDLIGRIEKNGRMDPATAVAMARKLAEGLAFAHGRKIIHRDLKPHNVLLTPAGEPKLTDFGLAKFTESTQMTVDGAIMGSPAYMSPEQAEGKTADARSDVYSFGIMLFHMVAGRTPFNGDTRQVLMQHLTQPVPSLPDIPADLDAIIQKATARDPEHRFADGAQLAAALRSLTGESS